MQPTFSRRVAAREVPLHYPQIGKPASQTPFPSGPRPDPEVR